MGFSERVSIISIFSNERHCILSHCIRPMKAITANDNVKMPAWFDILGFAKGDYEKGSVDEAGMLESVEMGTPSFVCI